ncbi:hypothetical protein ACLM5J_07025 [Nocardioides sp. Bht2]|uniref:hypothetical protein n=1 Tax=Nocardioides sp. Bht2 TaxID=3392297 RepID=UPI0039B4AD54
MRRLSAAPFLALTLLLVTVSLGAWTSTATAAVDEPAWAHETVRAGEAVAWVEQAVSTDSGATLRLRGTGWTTTTGSSSTVAIKLNKAPTAQHARSGAGVVAHPSASGDTTIWVLLAPGGGAHPNVRAMQQGGEFDISIDLPAGLSAGDYLAVQFQSGRFDDTDRQRSVASAPLVVGGTPWTGGGEPEPGVVCDPQGAAASVTIVDDQVQIGGSLQLRGAGWCHPTNGGSVIGVKIDEGAYEHLTTGLHTNKTIWAIIEAEDDGTFDIAMPLPDGTAATSKPAMVSGAHSLRLLTGSLKAGDTGRTLKSADFTVGAYRPTVAPDPVEATEQLTSATRGGLVVRQSTSGISVQLPAADRPQWAFLTVYAADGSPRYPWASWIQVPASGTLQASLKGVTLPEGRPRLVVQRGDRGRVGELVGWARLVGPKPTSEKPGKEKDPESKNGTDTPVKPSPSAPASPTVASVPQVVDAPQQPVAPAPALPSEDQVLAALAEPVASSRSGSALRLTVPDGKPGEQYFVAVYNPPTAIGWVELDADGRFRIDVSALQGASHRIVVLDATGKPVSWTWSSIPPRTSVIAEELTAAPAPVAGPAQASAADERDPIGESDLWLVIAGLVGLLGAVLWTRRGVKGA